jgi:ATP-dependent Clp protease adaptor protein ClpS
LSIIFGKELPFPERTGKLEIMPKFLPKGEEQVLTEEKPKTKKPPLYKVLLHNDDYTTTEFVVYILMKYFQKSETQATEIMLSVHNNGMGTAGVYTYEIAESKVMQVTEEARRNEYPLRSTLEQA